MIFNRRKKEIEKKDLEFREDVEHKEYIIICDEICELLSIESPYLNLNKELKEKVRDASTITPLDDKRIKKCLVELDKDLFNNNNYYIVAVMAHELRHCYQYYYKQELLNNPAITFEESQKHPGEIDADAFAIAYLVYKFDRVYDFEGVFKYVCKEYNPALKNARISKAEELYEEFFGNGNYNKNYKGFFIMWNYMIKNYENDYDTLVEDKYKEILEVYHHVLLNNQPDTIPDRGTFEEYLTARNELYNVILEYSKKSKNDNKEMKIDFERLASDEEGYKRNAHNEINMFYFFIKYIHIKELHKNIFETACKLIQAYSFKPNKGQLEELNKLIDWEYVKSKTNNKMLNDTGMLGIESSDNSDDSKGA